MESRDAFKDRILNVRQVADMLGVSGLMVRRMAEKGILTVGKKVSNRYLFLESDIFIYMDKKGIKK
jgi:predicted site-specific integrase-resolvase